MPNLRNAAIRARIWEAFAECRTCHVPFVGVCNDHCAEAVNTALDEIIDDLREQFGPKVRCGECEKGTVYGQDAFGLWYRCPHLGYLLRGDSHCAWGVKRGDAE